MFETKSTHIETKSVFQQGKSIRRRDTHVVERLSALQVGFNVKSTLNRRDILYRKTVKWLFQRPVNAGINAVIEFN